MMHEEFNEDKKREERINERGRHPSADMLDWTRSQWSSWWDDGVQRSHASETGASYRDFAPLSLPAGGPSFDPRGKAGDLGQELMLLFARDAEGKAKDKFADMVIVSCSDETIIDSKAKAAFVLDVAKLAAPSRMTEVLETLLQSAKRGHFDIGASFVSSAVYSFNDHVSKEDKPKIALLLRPYVKDYGSAMAQSSFAQTARGLTP